MSIITRKLQKGDADRVAELAGQLGYPVSTAVLIERINQCFGLESSELYVAIDSSSEIVGWLQVVIDRLLIATPYAEIRSLVVDKEKRGKGVGRMLALQAEQWAKDQGVGIMRVRSKIERYEAHDFYLGLGYALSKTQRVFGKKL